MAEPAAAAGSLFRLAARLYLVLAVAGLAWIGVRNDGIAWTLFAPASGWWIDLLAGVGAAAGLLAAWWLLLRTTTLAPRLEQRLAEALGPLPTHEAYGLALLSGIAEEVFFRGAVQPAWGVVPATLLFALLHSGRGPEMRLWSVGALVAGGILAGLMAWRAHLLAPIVCHVAVNAVQLRRLAQARPPHPC